MSNMSPFLTNENCDFGLGWQLLRVAQTRSMLVLLSLNYPLPYSTKEF
jgi:hypothetical protein